MKITNRNEVDICDKDITTPEEWSQDELTSIIRKFSELQYGYTTKGDVIQFVSESLDIPENIAEWIINYLRKVTE